MEHSRHARPSGGKSINARREEPNASGTLESALGGAGLLFRSLWRESQSLPDTIGGLDPMPSLGCATVISSAVARSDQQGQWR